MRPREGAIVHSYGKRVHGCPVRAVADRVAAGNARLGPFLENAGEKGGGTDIRSCEPEASQHPYSVCALEVAFHHDSRRLVSTAKIPGHWKSVPIAY